MLLLVSVLCTALLTYAVLQAPSLFVHRDPAVTANVYVYETIDGQQNLIGSAEGNIITDFGEARALNALVGTATDITGIAVGTEASIDQTDTGLTTEETTNGFERVACNVSTVWDNGGDSAINFTASFDATAQVTVNSAILTLSTVGATADAMAISFLTDGSDHQFPTSSRLTVVWVLTLNAN